MSFLHTRLCELFGIETPIMNAPMAGAAGGKLAAAVSEAGGLGLIGAMSGDADWLRTQIRTVRERTARPFGVGFLTQRLPLVPELYQIALEERVPVIVHSFADPTSYVSAAKAAGANVICQVQTVEGAIQAAQARVDAIVAQGIEAGGHTGSMSLMTLVPQVASKVSPLPVIAAGAIADGRAFAAALMLGAEGIWMGTAFLASLESLYSVNQKRRILDMSSDETILTRVFDIARGIPWPEHIAGRAARNAFTDRWHGRERELERSAKEATDELDAAVATDDVAFRPVWAGQGVALVTTVRSAGDIVRAVTGEAEHVVAERCREIERS